jgi:hypothetical protein
MERVGKINPQERHPEFDNLIGFPVYLVTMATAASIIGESIEDTERLVFAGHLIGFMPFEKGSWHVVVRSLERWIGRPMSINPEEG